MPLSRMTKFKIFLVFFGMIALVALWQVGRYYYYRGWSVGTRTGFVRKMALKGPPYCKYIMGELVLQRGGEVASGGEILEFSVDTKDEESKIVKDLRHAEKEGKLATLRYRQDLNMWWRCAPTEYFVTGVE
jgi:hypothetical protein